MSNPSEQTRNKRLKMWFWVRSKFKYLPQTLIFLKVNDFSITSVKQHKKCLDDTFERFFYVWNVWFFALLTFADLLLHASIVNLINGLNLDWISHEINHYVFYSLDAQKGHATWTWWIASHRILEKDNLVNKRFVRFLKISTVAKNEKEPK